MAKAKNKIVWKFNARIPGLGACKSGNPVGEAGHKALKDAGLSADTYTVKIAIKSSEKED